MLDLLFEYGVTRCYYGHLHGAGHTAAYIGDYYGMQFSMISADFVDFTPVFVKSHVKLCKKTIYFCDGL